MRAKFKPPHQIDTWAEVAGEYFDEGTAEIDYEDDHCVLCSFEVAGRGDLMNFMTDSEISEVEERLYSDLCTQAAEWAEVYGDYLYEQAKDRRLGL